MKLFDVYPLYDINIVKGQGCKVWDENGTEYLTSTEAMPSSPSDTRIPTMWR